MTTGYPKPPVIVAPFDVTSWQVAFVDDFGTDVPLGQFPEAVPTWDAYPYPWGDTATKLGNAVGGVYDPHTTTWIENGYLHVKMWQGTAPPNHVSCPFPVITNGVTYGRFIEVTKVTVATVGYKSAHLLWPVSGVDWEIDFPENEWAGTSASWPHAFDHYNKTTTNDKIGFSTNAQWTDWHTYEIRWAPAYVNFYVDAALIGSVTNPAAIPQTAGKWRLQNESALVGSPAAPNSQAWMKTSHVEFWNWTP